MILMFWAGNVEVPENEIKVLKFELILNVKLD